MWSGKTNFQSVPSPALLKVKINGWCSYCTRLRARKSEREIWRPALEPGGFWAHCCRRHHLGYVCARIHAHTIICLRPPGSQKKREKSAPCELSLSSFAEVVTGNNNESPHPSTHPPTVARAASLSSHFPACASQHNRALSILTQVCAIRLYHAAPTTTLQARCERPLPSPLPLTSNTLT